MTDHRGHRFGPPKVPDGIRDGVRLDDGSRTWTCLRCGLEVWGQDGPRPPNPCAGQRPHLLKHDELREHHQWTAIGPAGRLGPDFDTREQALKCLEGIGVTIVGRPIVTGGRQTFWPCWRPEAPPTLPAFE